MERLKESAYWLELLVDGEIVPAAKLQPLRQECDELTAIFLTIIKRAKAQAREPLPHSYFLLPPFHGATN